MSPRGAGASTVCFGALALRPGGSGVQTYEREIIAALDRHADAAASGRWGFQAVVQQDAAQELPGSVRALTRPVCGGVRRALEGLKPVGGVDVFHSLDVDLPVAQRGATVSTVHDMSVFDTPWAMSAVRARGEQMLLRRSLHRADAIISVSHFTAERVLELTGRESTVIPLAPAPWAHVPDAAAVARVREKYGLPQTFVLQLGTLEPRKRPDVVAEALRTVPGPGGTRGDVPLVLGGAHTDSAERPEGTIGLGYVDQEDVPALYRAARVVAYASAYEGFGLPPVEAMACGAVVVASAVGGIPQAVGNGAVVVPQLSAQAWSTALDAALHDRDLREHLAVTAPARVAELTWDAAAAATAEVYATLV